MNGSGYFALALGCALVAVIAGLKARQICDWLNLIDVPTDRKQHRVATPLMGGVMVLAAFVPFATIYVIAMSSERWMPTLLIWLGCVTAMALVGIADDRHSLSPKARLFISFVVFGLAAAIDATFNVRVLDFNFPRWGVGLGTWWFAIVFTVICCVGLINAINMADGKNGLVLGLSLGWLSILATRAPEAMLPIMLLFGIIIFVLFIFNMKGRLFLGDGGAYAIAAGLGLLAIIIYNTPGTKMLRSVSADEIVLLFMVPVLDSFRLTYARLRQGRSPMSADRDHLHHHIQGIFGWPTGLVLYWVLALAPAAFLFLYASNT